MKYFLFFSILIMATSFDSSKQELKNNPIYLETISKAEFDAIKNKSGFRMSDFYLNDGEEVIDDFGSVKRDSLDLILNLSNGKKLVFTNKGDDAPEVFVYRYRKYIAALDSWIIDRSGLGYGETIIVDKEDGKIKEFDLLSELDFSPDMSKLISWSPINEMDAHAGHLSYYKRNNKLTINTQV